MKDFDKLLEEENVSLNIEKQIKRKMNKSIYSRVVIILLCVSLIGIFLYKGSSKIQEIAHYNPKNESHFLLENQENYEFNVLLSTYVSMNYPGKIIHVDEVVEKDFGVYEYRGMLQDSFDPLVYGGFDDITLSINASHVQIEYQPTADTYLTTYINQFRNPNPSEEFYEITQLDDIYQDIKDLPDSAYISASISFNDYISLEDVVELIKKYPETSFVWLAIASETQRSPQVAEGMVLSDSFLWDFNEEALKEYPNFYIWNKEEITAEALYQKYLSNMKLLLDHPDFLDVMKSLDSYLCPKDRLLERYEEAKNGVQGYGFRVNIGKKDVLKIMEDEDISYVVIHDVKISKWAQ